MLIFLDIDGVMVPAKSWKSPEFLSDGFPAFSVKATHSLQKLISDGGDILLTTSHRAKFNVEEWKNIFERRGINVRNIATLPENANGISRKDEIVNWINHKHIKRNFVIIDDDKSLNDLPKSLKKFLIQTSSHIGLTDAHIEEINNISGQELKA